MTPTPTTPDHDSTDQPLIDALWQQLRYPPDRTDPVSDDFASAVHTALENHRTAGHPLFTSVVHACCGDAVSLRTELDRAVERATTLEQLLERSETGHVTFTGPDGAELHPDWCRECRVDTARGLVPAALNIALGLAPDSTTQAAVASVSGLRAGPYSGHDHPNCRLCCGAGITCESHPTLAWGDGLGPQFATDPAVCFCGGAGVPCPRCYPSQWLTSAGAPEHSPFGHCQVIDVPNGDGGTRPVSVQSTGPMSPQATAALGELVAAAEQRLADEHPHAAVIQELMLTGMRVRAVLPAGSVELKARFRAAVEAARAVLAVAPALPLWRVGDRVRVGSSFGTVQAPTRRARVQLDGQLAVIEVEESFVHAADDPAAVEQLVAVQRSAEPVVLRAEPDDAYLPRVLQVAEVLRSHAPDDSHQGFCHCGSAIPDLEVHQAMALIQDGLVEVDETRHVIEFREEGWTIKHPLACRPALFACAVNRAAEQQLLGTNRWKDTLDGPVMYLGRFFLDLRDGQLVIEEPVDGDRP